MYRIALVGAHGVGKTTLVDYLDRNWGHKIIKEIPRKVITSGKIDKNDYEHLEVAMLREQIKAEEKAILDGDPVIMDRSLIDILAYTFYFYDQMKIKKEVYTMIRDTILSFIRDMPYDVIIYIPIMFDLVDDGVRMDKKSQNEIDIIIREMLGLIVNPYIALPFKPAKEIYPLLSRNLDDRIDEIKMIVRRLQDGKKVYE